MIAREGSERVPAAIPAASTRCPTPTVRPTTTPYNNLPVTFLLNTQGDVDRVSSAAAAGFPDRQAGYYQVNLGAGYSPDGDLWRLEGYVSNVFDKTVSQKEIAGSGVNIRFLNEARTCGMRISMKF